MVEVFMLHPVRCNCDAVSQVPDFNASGSRNRDITHSDSTRTLSKQSATAA
jgi:hypothetical protein